MPLCALVRFGKWDAVLKEARPPADLRYITGLWHYARALAFAATDQLAEARTEQADLNAVLTTFDAGRANDGPATRPPICSILPPRSWPENWRPRRARPMRRFGSWKKRLPAKTGCAIANRRPGIIRSANRSGRCCSTPAGRPRPRPSTARICDAIPTTAGRCTGWPKACAAKTKRAQARRVERAFQKAWARADVRLRASRF